MIPLREKHLTLDPLVQTREGWRKTADDPVGAMRAAILTRFRSFHGCRQSLGAKASLRRRAVNMLGPSEQFASADGNIPTGFRHAQSAILGSCRGLIWPIGILTPKMLISINKQILPKARDLVRSEPATANTYGAPRSVGAGGAAKPRAGSLCKIRARHAANARRGDARFCAGSQQSPTGPSRGSHDIPPVARPVLPDYGKRLDGAGAFVARLCA